MRRELNCAPVDRTLGSFPQGGLRLSPGYFTTPGQLTEFLEALAAARLRRGRRRREYRGLDPAAFNTGEVRRHMYYAGIDIGSTASKAVVMNASKDEILARKLMPSGWNGRETAEEILTWLLSLGYAREEIRITATGYGRVSVPYADDTLTEITCHGKGACFLGGENLTVVDIGGQDTKVILVRNGRVVDFIMNDKCSAGTGKFLEIMANRMGVTLPELFELAERGREIVISSMCTVFAESEIVSLMGLGTPREDIACGAVGSVVAKVAVQVARKAAAEAYFLTGGFCDSAMMLRKLSEALNAPVRTGPDARFAGAIGAALLGK